jgi:hypothetical protein
VKAFVYLSALLVLVLSSGRDAFAQAQQSPLKAPPLQEWQIRREKLDHVINGARQNDPDSLKQFNQILTEMEQHPHDRTPMEVLDVLGTYYVPNEGLEPTLSVIATQLVLGWYDALRFGTHSGRAEILDNEQFFKRAMVLSGNDVTNQSLKFLNERQDRAAQLVAEGIKEAEPFRDVPSYDRKWPTAYGLERLLCASGDAEKCSAAPALPKDQWDKAWAESKKAVTDFLVMKK